MNCLKNLSMKNQFYMWVVRRPFIPTIFRNRFNIRLSVIYTGCTGLIRSPCLVYYSGSPLSYSFAEANQKKYVLLVDVEPGKVATVQELELTKGKKLLRKRAEGIDEALLWLTENPDCLVELTMVTDIYLTAQERKQLSAAHNGIVTIIPEVKNASEFSGGNKKAST